MSEGEDGCEAARRDALSRALIEEGDRLYGLALRTTRDPDLAADAVQEAFTSALEKGAAFRGDSALGTWLHRIVFNKSIDLLRRRRRYVALPEAEPEVLTQGDVRLAHAASWARPPEDLLLGAETRNALERALDALHDKYRSQYGLHPPTAPAIVVDVEEWRGWSAGA